MKHGVKDALTKEQDSTYPKVMEVSNYDDFVTSTIRVVFAEENGKFIAWNNARTLEEAENSVVLSVWNFAREIQQDNTIQEVTLAEIAEWKNVDVSLIRIKQ